MILHSKRLLSLWDRKAYGSDKKPINKPIDGVFIFNCLFSVSAFASRPDESLSTKLSKSTTEKLVNKVRALRNEINKLNLTLINNVGNIDLNQMGSDYSVTVDMDTKRYTSLTVMLLKVFMACDEYFISLHKAKLNGEITDSEFQTYRKESVALISQFLQDTNKTCTSFHKIRKQAEKTK